jgi:hypothetical protein
MEMNLDTAKMIAEDAIRERIAASSVFSRYQFAPVAFTEENERFWVFVSGSDELFDAGATPTAIYICVDKKDGHLWSREEQERFYSQTVTTN